MADGARPLRLLSLDGGGVRGLSELVILKRIMFNLGSLLGRPANDLPKPCEYFDLIGGTSTGGLIALMLGTLEMDIDTYFSRREGFVGGSSFGKLFKGAVGYNRFAAEPFETVLQKLIEKKFPALGPDVILDEAKSHSDKHTCKAFVCSTNSDTSTVFRLRDYKSTWEPSTGCKIWEAARATTAAPLFFPPAKFGVPVQNWVDGGLRSNNPIRHVYDEANLIWPERSVKCIVSLGTGAAPAQPVGTRGKEILETVARIALDAKQTATEFRDAVSHLPLQSRFEISRFSVDVINAIPLQEWKQFASVTGLTNDYLSHHRDEVNRCAVLLGDGIQKAASSKTIHLSTLPLTIRSFFGRKAEMERLREVLHPHKEKQQPLVIEALSGFGKTRLVLEYVEKESQRYDIVLWINASSYENAYESFVEAATSISDLHLSSRSQVMPALTTKLDAVNTVRGFLERTSSTWILVIDSYDSIDDFNAREFLPRSSGSIVVTTTRHGLAESWGAATLSLEELDLEASCELLTQRFSGARCSMLNKSAVENAVRLLSGIPLALEQASVVLSKGTSLEEFGQHFKTDYQYLMSRKPAMGTWTYDKNQTIFAAFESLRGALQKEDDESVFLLSIFCFFANARIPLRILQSFATTEDSDITTLGHDKNQRALMMAVKEIVGRLLLLTGNGLRFKTLIGLLEDFCVVNVRKDVLGFAVSITVHEAIRQWCQRREDAERIRAFSFVIAFVLASYWQLLEGTKKAHAFDYNLKVHFISCWSFLCQDFFEHPNDSILNVRPSITSSFGHYFIKAGLYDLAVTALQLSVESYMVQQGVDWPRDRLSRELLFSLGNAHWLAGQRTQAEQVLQELLNSKPGKLPVEDDALVQQVVSLLKKVKDRIQRDSFAAQAAASRSLAKSPPERSLPPVPETGQGASSAEDYEEELKRLKQKLHENEAAYRTRRHPVPYETRIQLASLYFSQEDFRNAINFSEEVAKYFFTDLYRPISSVLSRHVDSEEWGSLPGRAGKCYFASLAACGVLSEELHEQFKLALAFAIARGEQELVYLFVENGAPLSPDICMGLPCPMLCLAAGRGNATTITFLLEKSADISISDKEGYNALHWAAWFHNRETFQALLDNGLYIGSTGHDGGTVLHAASWRRRVPPERMALLWQANLETHTLTASQVQEASICEEEVEFVAHLIELGAPINKPNDFGETALSYTVDRGHIFLAQVLLKSGADPNGSDPVDRAASKPGKINSYMTKLLLDFGAEPRDETLAKIDEIAQGSPDIAELLKSWRANRQRKGVGKADKANKQNERRAGGKARIWSRLRSRETGDKK